MIVYSERTFDAFLYQVLAQTFDATLCLLMAELTTIQFHGKQKRQRFQQCIFVAAPNFWISSVCRDFESVS